MKEQGKERPKVAVYLGNHHPRYVTDQFLFLVHALRQQGYPVILSRSLQADRLNLVIEAFGRDEVVKLETFCADRKKKIAVVLTEHVESTRRGLYVNHSPIEKEDGYWDKGVRRLRVNSLIRVSRIAPFQLRLGDMPIIDGLNQLIGPFDLISIPFPDIRPIRSPGDEPQPVFDFLFSGSMTPYRESLLRMIAQRARVHVAKGMLLPRQRLWVHGRTRWVLDLPQHHRWTSISIMRVLASLAMGCPTIAVKPGNGSAIDEFCIRITPEDIQDGLPGPVLDGYKARAEAMRTRYNALVSAQTGWPSVHDAFADWALSERVAFEAPVQ